MELSLCMIVRNEERNLRRCLESVKGLVSEIVIVDTGSTDRTLEIAREYTDKVYSFPFQYVEFEGAMVEDIDFASARNESLKHATKDWILVLDADEYVEEKDFPLFQKLFDMLQKHENVLGIQLPVYNLMKDSKDAVKHYRVCIVKNDHRIRYEGKIHEMPGNSIAEAGGVMVKAEIPVYHTGYMDQESANEKIRNRNIPILLREHKRNPDHYGYTFYLGKSYLTILNDLNQAKYFLKKTIEKCKDNLAVILESKFYLGLIAERENRVKDALQIWKEIIEKDKNFPDPYFCVGFIFYRDERYDTAIPFLEQVLKCNTARTVVNIMSFTYTVKKIYEMLCKCYAECGEFARAIEYRIKEDEV